MTANAPTPFKQKMLEALQREADNHSPPVDPFRTALEEMCPEMFFEADEATLKYASMTAEEVVMEVFPDNLYSKEEREAILWGETGFPDFWDQTLGQTPINILLRQLWNARARRELQYYNLEILESDFFLGMVNHIKFKPQHEVRGDEYNWSRCQIDIGDELSIVAHTNGEWEVIEPGGNIVKSKPKPLAPLCGRYEEPLQINPNPYLMTSDVMQTFVGYIKNMGYEYDKDMPVSIFFKWLSAMAECEEKKEIDPSVREWIEDELKKFYSST